MIEQSIVLGAVALTIFIALYACYNIIKMRRRFNSRRIDIKFGKFNTTLEKIKKHSESGESWLRGE